jgi:hypothetical protein
MKEMREGDRKVALDANGCVRMRAMREAQMRHVRTEAKQDRPSVVDVCVSDSRAGRAWLEEPQQKGKWIDSYLVSTHGT